MDIAKHPPVLQVLVVVFGSVVGRDCILEAAPVWRWVGGELAHHLAVAVLKWKIILLFCEQTMNAPMSLPFKEKLSLVTVTK